MTGAQKIALFYLGMMCGAAMMALTVVMLFGPCR